MHKAMIVIISSLLFGCSMSTTKQANVADVTSNPAGATVYANGLILGETPLQHALYEAFPASWSGGTYQARGVLTLKKAGCEEYTLKISDYILSQPIHADLKCSPTSTTQTKNNNTENSAILSTAKPVQNTIEKRISELEALYNKGVITKDEYEKNRARILNEL